MNIRSLQTSFAAMLLVLVGACGGGGNIRTDAVKAPSEALPPAPDTPVARAAEPEQAVRPPSQSGFRLLTLNTNALLSRVVLAQKATQSIDLQTYIYEDDDTGRLVADALIKAADRGVRVRMLVDDITKKEGSATLFDAMEAHENIEVRLFNPFSSRNPGAVSKAAQMLVDFRRLNRRMHNKSFIVDNKVAIIGGRNIADDYFDASGQDNYRDLDLLAIGPVVEQASRAFDTYWNDEAALPASAWTSAKDSPEDLAKARQAIGKRVRAFAQSDYAAAAFEEMPDGPTADRQGSWFWGEAVMAADQPEKIVADADQPELRVGDKVKELMYGAKSELLVISPYFVPSKPDREALVALAQKGVSTRILTNSLASTDQPIVHSGYSPARKELLAGGVQLYEMKPYAGVQQTTAQDPGKKVALHAKAFVVDGRHTFVGSMNMDQRSALLNTEQGIVVDSPALAKAVAQYFASATLPANAWRLALEDEEGDGGMGEILWISEENGQSKTRDTEPDTSALERGKIQLLKLLPIDGLL